MLLLLQLQSCQEIAGKIVRLAMQKDNGKGGPNIFI